MIGRGVELDSLEAVTEKKMMSKLVSILNNVSHPLNDMLVERRSIFSQRLIPTRGFTERHRRQFLPVAIKPFNSSPLCR